MLGPLIGEMLGVEKAPITYSEDGRGHQALVHAPAAFRRRGVFVADYEIDAA